MPATSAGPAVTPGKAIRRAKSVIAMSSAKPFSPPPPFHPKAAPTPPTTAARNFATPSWPKGKGEGPGWATLGYAGYIGGAGDDFGGGIAADSAGNAYVVGTTGSTQAIFPVLNGPALTSNGGSSDVFVAKLNAGGATLGYAGYVGGADLDQGIGIALDSFGAAYITGQTLSDQTTFPVTGGPGRIFAGLGDAYGAKTISVLPTDFLFLLRIIR